MDILMAMAALALGYLVGAIPSGLLIGKWTAGVDLREHGSKNIGFTNAVRVLGWKRGLPVLFIDVGKSWGATFFLPMLAGGFAYLPLFVGGMVMAGNTANVFLGFKGGKGVATACGVFLALTPVGLLAALAAFLLVIAATRYVSLGSIGAAVVLPAATAWRQGFGAMFVLTAVVGALVIIKHRSNIKRLMAGTENKVGRRKPADGSRRAND